MHTHTHTHPHKPKLPIYFILLLLHRGVSEFVSKVTPPPTPSCLTSSLFTRRSSSIRFNLHYKFSFFAKLVFPSRTFSLHLLLCISSHLSPLSCCPSASAGTVLLHPHVCVCVCLHMCMRVFCPCALRSPSWTGCLAIINLSQHLKSHLR